MGLSNKRSLLLSSLTDVTNSVQSVWTASTALSTCSFERAGCNAIWTTLYFQSESTSRRFGFVLLVRSCSQCLADQFSKLAMASAERGSRGDVLTTPTTANRMSQQFSFHIPFFIIRLCAHFFFHPCSADQSILIIIGLLSINHSHNEPTSVPIIFFRRRRHPTPHQWHSLPVEANRTEEL